MRGDLFPTVLVDGKSKIKIIVNLILWCGFSFWLANVYFPAISSHGRDLKLWSLPLFINTLIPSWDPTALILSKPNYLPKDPMLYHIEG